jgi:hypothetical protein
VQKFTELLTCLGAGHLVNRITACLVTG